MSEPSPRPSVLELLALREVRGYLRRSHGIALAVFIGVAYTLGSMVLGGMLIIARFPGGYSVLLLWGNALGLQPWNYPGLLIEAPWGFIELPFFATLSMIVVAVGVALGMGVAILLGVQLVRDHRRSAGRPAAAGAMAGLTPAMIALVTLGACCSTTAAATAGVGLVAEASGSSASNLLLNNWFLGVFQMVVVYVALIAQELLLRVYGNLFAQGDPGFAPFAEPARVVDRRLVLATAARAALLAAGITWVLTVLADWTVVSPSSASAGLWFNWVIEHWLLGGFAVLAGLSPRTVGRWLRAAPEKASSYALRILLAVGAWTLGAWVPPPLSGTGVEGFGNELLGAFGAPSSVGAVAPVFAWGVPLFFQWAFQYLLLAGFAAGAAIAPRSAFGWLAGADEGPQVVPVRDPLAASATPTVPDVR